VDKQVIGEEDMFQWLWWGDLKGETKTETVAVKDQASQTKYQAKQIFQTETANTDSANYLKGQWNTSYQHAQYWQKNSA
jgi:hypothetical protein